MKSVIIAHKYNDVYYALNTLEFKESNYRVLIIIEKGLITRDDFPFKYYFDEIESLNVKSNLEYIKLLFKLNLILSNYNSITYIFLSNPILLINQRIEKIINPNAIILLEDGVMNYKQFIPSKAIIKQMVQRLLGISNNRMYDKIIETYLLKPEDAKYAFGKVKKLEVSNIEDQIKAGLKKKLNNKKIFVGNDLYRYGYTNIDDYNFMLNKVINEFKIDYYIPHAFASYKEKAECEILDLSSEAITLEMIAGTVNHFEIYSFGSSVNYSCKYINRNIKSILIYSTIFSFPMSDFILENSDLVYYANKENIQKKFTPREDI